LDFFKQEIRSDFDKTKEAVFTLMIGLALLLAGIACFLPMGVHLLHEGSGWPLWACYALVGAVLALVGAFVTYFGKRRFASFNPLPDESARTLKENVQCLIGRK